MTNCPNCNAPIKGQRCEYCGTVFENYDATLASKEIQCLYTEAINAMRNYTITEPEDVTQNYIRELEFEAKRTEAMVKYSQICKRQLNEIYEDHNAWNDALATIVWACAGIPFVLLIVDLLRGILGA